MGTFLTLRGVSEDVPDEKIEETQEDEEAYQRPSEEEKTEAEEDKPGDSEEETETEEDKPEDSEEPEVLETVIAEAVVEEPVDHGDYEPGTKVSHTIFGIGEVKDSKPKGAMVAYYGLISYIFALIIEKYSTKTGIASFFIYGGIVEILFGHVGDIASFVVFGILYIFLFGVPSPFFLSV